MYFFGQKEIVQEVNFLIQDINSGRNHNIIFRAPSGYGKTSLALNILYWTGWDKNGEYLIPENGEINLNLDKVVHVIDEVHTLESPEFLYPIMDSGRYTFILCSNESGRLLEPLRNRCVQFIFKDYTDEEILEMLEFFLADQNIPKEFIPIIASRTKNNPRIAHKLCERLSYVFRWNGTPKTSEQLMDVMDNLLIVLPGGLNQQDLLYLNFLKTAGSSSLENISRATGIDKYTIQYEIEPFLVYKGMVKITSRGRQYVQQHIETD